MKSSPSTSSLQLTTTALKPAAINSLTISKGETFQSGSTGVIFKSLQTRSTQLSWSSR
ncbi:MAG: hypothetical protein V1727_05910 [Candidatus Omnitrophota bacterium]